MVAPAVMEEVVREVFVVVTSDLRQIRMQLGRSRTPPISDEPISFAEEASSPTSSSSSNGYTPSPPAMNQPIDLGSLLTIPGRGRGAARGQGGQGRGRRTQTQTDAPPGFSPEEIEAIHREKRQRVEQPQERPPPPSSSPAPIWAPSFSHGNRAITARDTVETEGTALALSQAFLLPGDMQKEVAMSPDNLLSSFMSHNAKVMQKMVAMAQKLSQSEPQRAKLVSENSKLQRTIIRLERERNQAQGVADGLKGQLKGTEDSLAQTLKELETSQSEAKAAFEKGYNEGIKVATESYTNQMPGIQDQVWVASWRACLEKAEIPESSPLWTNIELPSAAAGDQEEIVEEGDEEQVLQTAEPPVTEVEPQSDMTNSGQKEASGGQLEDENLTAAEAPPTVPTTVQDLTEDE
ncbi:uncharacterized protein LOC131317485 [Rhododendron vialii]|uniref:uncharacterized protein LOC131317485 n=1 Tax=Rhododendron vialii TaxID=182163 RepID=UPI00265D8218|nr:uncharacterized protein LOC131317485 [Rhododendron vialii]